uniref:Uncharacterized protein n=1 Tax=Molossus molossus TaxID=27622 RepID=A0A7J8BYH0_MOLMO|nr:hypothetical protein HJG59_010047 [Molossus molossus]
MLSVTCVYDLSPSSLLYPAPSVLRNDCRRQKNSHPQRKGMWSSLPRALFHPLALWLGTNAAPLPRAGYCWRVDKGQTHVLPLSVKFKDGANGLYDSSQISHSRLSCCLNLQALDKVDLQGRHFQWGALSIVPIRLRLLCTLKIPDHHF